VTSRTWLLSVVVAQETVEIFWLNALELSLKPPIGQRNSATAFR
jgi:hypothetical protein